MYKSHVHHYYYLSIQNLWLHSTFVMENLESIVKKHTVKKQFYIYVRKVSING